MPDSLADRHGKYVTISGVRFAYVNGEERSPIFGTIRCPTFGALRCPIFGTIRYSNAGGYPVAALASSSFTGALSTPALRLLLSL